MTTIHQPRSQYAAESTHPFRMLVLKFDDEVVSTISRFDSPAARLRNAFLNARYFKHMFVTGAAVPGSFTIWFTAGFVDYDDANSPDTPYIPVLRYHADTGLFEALAPIAKNMVRHLNSGDSYKIGHGNPAPKAIRNRHARLLAGAVSGTPHLGWTIQSWDSLFINSPYPVPDAKPVCTVHLADLEGHTAQVTVYVGEDPRDKTYVVSSGAEKWAGNAKSNVMVAIKNTCPPAYVYEQFAHYAIESRFCGFADDIGRFPFMHQFDASANPANCL